MPGDVLVARRNTVTEAGHGDGDVDAAQNDDHSRVLPGPPQPGSGDLDEDMLR